MGKILFLKLKKLIFEFDINQHLSYFFHMNAFQILCDLVNLGQHPLTIENVQTFLINWSFGYSPLGFHGFKLRDRENIYFFLSEDEREKAKAILEPVKSSISLNNNRFPLTNFIVLNDSTIQSEFLYRMNCLSQQATIFTEKCRTLGTVPLEFINEKFAGIQRPNTILKLAGPINQPTVNLIDIPVPYASLEEEMEIKIYLVPFLAGQGEQWVRSRICSECGKLFFYKLERAKYCSKLCRIRANNQRRSK